MKQKTEAKPAEKPIIEVLNTLAPAPEIRTPDSMAIRAQDIKPGMYLIPSHWQPGLESKPLEAIALDSRGNKQGISRNIRPVGFPFKVLATALPFITVRYEAEIFEDMRGVIDTRECSLIKVSKEYADSLVPVSSKEVAEAQQRPKTKRIWKNGMFIDVPEEST